MSETVIICAECGELLEEVGYSNDHDWESWTICPGCRTIEGDTEEITIEEYEARQL